MLAITGHSRFFLFQHPVDMRKGLEGLAALAEEQCSGQLTKGDYFIFVSKGRRIVKILYWDNDGFAVWWKQLAQGRFWLPRTRYFQMLCLESLNAP
ncbi:IS66 family insertion sequence element accessory protein TnpB [Waddlia chondrophila]|uniref:Transposase n=1 Tax=Waddlia chondrophila (strain ATCC VR-1470 / WSU 86-1044) TaxID=716544 RepID=D6YTG6_WADCW|nr:IS66 family insertion sequence element accessory protein TnpB [Waddlia chondrophila]ADI37427.1 transposase [Waddlia chondrophila WSU 86-1044]